MSLIGSLAMRKKLELRRRALPLRHVEMFGSLLLQRKIRQSMFNAMQRADMRQITCSMSALGQAKPWLARERHAMTLSAF